MAVKYILTLCLIFKFLAIESKQINFVDSNGNLHDVTNPNQLDNDQSWAAWAYYDNGINRTGWAQLEVHTNPALNDSQQAYSGGLIEGYLTSDLIEFHFNNNILHYCDNSTQYCDRLFRFIQTNIEFTKSQIARYAKTDPFWRQIELSLIQLTAIDDGFNYMKRGIKPKGARIDINATGLILLNLITELGDLEQVLAKNKNKTIDMDDGHCSAIIKVLADGSDLFVSHNSWTTYSWMIRILKKYVFNYSQISANSIAFSSYPGTIFSIDDYYLMSSGLAVLETSIANYNNSLWANVVADRVVFEFLRNTAANRLARDGKEWSHIFSLYNSGTYNNQFMIVDYNKFVSGTHPSQLPDNLLWVLEQLPGFVHSADVTEVLRQQHYWPSYNVPFFKSVYQLSDYESQVEKYGDFFTYDRTARALIFRRDQNNVTDIPSLYRLMRYNDFKNDPLSRCNCSPPYTAEYAIASRCDLNDPDGSYPFKSLGFRPTGAIDVKMTNWQLFSKQEMIATSGPSYDTQPPFRWSTSKLANNVLHSGQPDLFKFSPVQVKWGPISQRTINL